MGVTSDEASALAGERTHDASGAPRSAPAAAQLAWAAVLPCAVATGLGVLVLGPLIGHLLPGPGGDRLWPREAFYVFGQAEPVKHGRFLVALLGPALLAGVVLAGAGRRQLRVHEDAVRALVRASELIVVALVLALLALQHLHHAAPRDWGIFKLAPFAIALALTGALVTAPRVPRLAGGVARLRTDSRRAGAVCLGVAICATVLWLLPAVTTDRGIANGPFPDLPPWAMGETYAILDGRTPLVNFVPLYGHLWAYVAAIPMRLLGATITTFSLTMTGISAVALLAVYALLRRILRRPLLALGLYLPLLATSLFVVKPVAGWRQGNGAVYSVWPMRYAGPLLLAWLLTRHLDGDGPRRRWPLFLAAGLVALNNLELGLGALVATAVALACDPALRSRAVLRRLAGEAAGGLLAALAVVVAIPLVRTGELPHFAMLVEFAHVFGVLGLAALPLPLIGFHLVIYVTFGGAIATAAVRVARAAPDLPLTGMLAWSGVFGLFAGSYFIGRSDALKLAALFPAWALSTMLLLVVALRALAARGWRRPAPAELLLVFAFGLMACSLGQLSPPWHEVRRLEARGSPLIYEQTEAHRLVRDRTRPGEHVAILIPMGHRIAYDVGVVNVSPYAFMDEIVTRRQFQALLGAMRREHAHKLFMLTSHLFPAQRRALNRAGFFERGQDAQYAYWTDRTVR